MAKNPPKDDARKGSVNDRSQFQHNDTWFKRDTETGRIMAGKKDREPFKGVAQELDLRRK